MGRVGRPFAQLVIEALDANRITAVDACRYLDLRFDLFEKLRGELRGSGVGQGLVRGAVNCRRTMSGKCWWPGGSG
jgi:hypothetical protein